MNKALIIYHSKTGTTRKMGQEIARLCTESNIESKVIPIEAFNKKDVAKVDYLFLGCWTHGHLIFNQHPEKEWVEFADKLPEIRYKKIVLFTTYKVATGSMFRKMKAHLKCEPNSVKLQLKSRNSRIKETDILTLKKILTN
jgi:flavodoxin